MWWDSLHCNKRILPKEADLSNDLMPTRHMTEILFNWAISLVWSSDSFLGGWQAIEEILFPVL